MAEYIVKETAYPLVTRQEIVGELVRCEDCARKPFCLSEVATVDKHKVQVSHESVKYCSLGERKDDS